jgi:hypothetical protein
VRNWERAEIVPALARLALVGVETEQRKDFPVIRQAERISYQVKPETVSAVPSEVEPSEAEEISGVKRLEYVPFDDC